MAPWQSSLRRDNGATRRHGFKDVLEKNVEISGFFLKCIRFNTIAHKQEIQVRKNVLLYFSSGKPGEKQKACNGCVPAN